MQHQFEKYMGAYVGSIPTHDLTNMKYQCFLVSVVCKASVQNYMNYIFVHILCAVAGLYTTFLELVTLFLYLCTFVLLPISRPFWFFMFFTFFGYGFILVPDFKVGIQGIAIALKCGATKAQFDSTVSSDSSIILAFLRHCLAIVTRAMM